MFVVTVTWKAKPDQTGAFAASLIRQARNSLTKEPNCLQFDVAVDPHDPTCFLLYEVYRAFHDNTESFDAPKQFIQPGSQRSAMRRIGQAG